ncbi:hypothetical protein [Haloferula sargassicola]|uniref:Uncharacterized protein n=1 Tax=Haloferula sargassicola TaxID=490096 RepID=A0ABP9UXQ9_9BACT
MKPITSFALLCAFAAVSNGAVTDPVGYFTVPLPGTGGGSAQKLQIANLGLLPSSGVEASGVIESFASDGGGTFLTDTEGSWSAGDYVNGTQVSHLVEITAVAGGDANLVGSMTWITASDANKLYLSDDISAAGAGASYRVVAAFTVESLLGNPPVAATFAGAGNVTDADNLLILDPTTNTYTTFWYKSSGLGGTGWRASGIDNSLVASTAIHPNDGLVFLRKQSADGSLVIVGDVKTTGTDIMVQGDGSGTVLNIVSIPIPVDQLTFAASNLYTGDNSTGLKGAGNVTDADNVLVFDATTNTYTTFWYKDSGLGGTGWRASGVADPANYVIPSERALLIQRKSGASFTWSVPAVDIAE